MPILSLIPDSVKRRALGLMLILAALGWFAAAWYAYKPKDFCVGHCNRQCQDRCLGRGFCPAASAD